MAITNLYASYTHPANRSGTESLPILVVMHGYGGGAFAGASGYAMLSRMSDYGVFAVSPGMRGRNTAGGSQDSSGRELFDIYDVVEHIRSEYAGLVSPTRVGIVGYSGGGGNALGCAAKFPDMFEVVVSHFGMSDYGVQDEPGGWPGTNTTWVGGTRAEVPDAYATRDYRASVATNYTGGHLWLYHDADDSSVPPIHSQQVADAMDLAGRTNYEISITDSGDAVRWIHGNPIVATVGAPNIQTEPNWLAAFAAGTHPAWTVPSSGTVDVRGYIVTKRFEVWLGGLTRAAAGAGLDEVATVEYDTATHSYEVTPVTGPCDVFIKEGALTGSASISSTTTIVVE